MKKSKSTKLVIRSGIRAGRLALNHNQRALKVRSSVKAGRLATNHNQKRVKRG